jgi:hypothetical protein
MAALTALNTGPLSNSEMLTHWSIRSERKGKGQRTKGEEPSEKENAERDNGTGCSSAKCGAVISCSFPRDVGDLLATSPNSHNAEAHQQKLTVVELVNKFQTS